MTTPTAHRHGYTGPHRCQDCPTTTGLHHGTWSNPTTGETGDFLQCCTCGINAGDPPSNHTTCNTPS
ncbi:hypothetical protein [Streptomyces omiyaensis]|uniref:hypothetical protein n=1 Tax=Streptomyces omiyaensis TaxID=68247 RepID=UPI0036FE1A7C